MVDVGPVPREMGSSDHSDSPVHRASTGACFLQSEIDSDFSREDSRHLSSVDVLDRRFIWEVRFPMGIGFPERPSSGAGHYLQLKAKYTLRVAFYRFPLNARGPNFLPF